MKKYDEIPQKEVDKTLEKVGNRLKELRTTKANYKSHENFAFDTGVGRSQYGRYEKGSDMRLSSLIKLCKAHEITLEEFFKDLK